MKSIDPVNLEARDNYKFLIGSIVPRPIAFVTTLSEDGILNGAPFSFFNVVSYDPPRVSISVQRNNGQQKDTARNAVSNKQFVVHIGDESYVNQMNQTAAAFNCTESEVEAASLTAVESTKVQVPGVKEAKIRMECELERALSFDGTSGTTCDLLIGRIVHYHIQKDLYENGRIDIDKLRPLSRLAGDDYMKLGEMFTLERPR